MPKLSTRSQLASDAGTLASVGQFLRGIEGDPRAKRALTPRQRALVEWLGAGREGIEDEERERGVHEERRARGLGLVARAGLLAGYPDDVAGRRAIRRDLDKPNVLLARLQAAQKRVLAAQLPAIDRLEDLAHNARSERVSRDAARDLLELAGLWSEGGRGAGGGVSINIRLGTATRSAKGDGDDHAVDVTPE